MVLLFSWMALATTLTLQGDARVPSSANASHQSLRRVRVNGQPTVTFEGGWLVVTQYGVPSDVWFDGDWQVRLTAEEVTGIGAPEVQLQIGIQDWARAQNPGTINAVRAAVTELPAQVERLGKSEPAASHTRAIELGKAKLAEMYIRSVDRRKIALDADFYLELRDVVRWTPEAVHLSSFRSMARYYGAYCCDPTAPGADGALEIVLDRTDAIGGHTAAEATLRRSLSLARRPHQIDELHTAVDAWAQAGAPVQALVQLREMVAKKVPIERGTILPDVRLPDLQGTEHALSEYRGKPVLLDFWASWCVPCVASIPKKRELAQAWAGRATLVGAAWENTAQASRFRAFLKNREWTEGWVHLIDLDRRSQQAYGVVRLPTYMVLDGKGRLVGETHDIHDVPALLGRAARAK